MNNAEDQGTFVDDDLDAVVVDVDGHGVIDVDGHGVVDVDGPDYDEDQELAFERALTEDVDTPTAEVIVLFPDVHGTGNGEASAMVTKLREQLRSVRDQLAAREARIGKLRAQVASLEYGAGIADRHIGLLERERDEAGVERARLEAELRESSDALAAARARANAAELELDKARADNVATVEILELEHQQALAHEKRNQENRIAAAEHRRAAEVSAVERSVAQRLLDAEENHSVAESMLLAERARAIEDLEDENRAALRRADVRAAQALALQYLLLANQPND